MITLISNHSGGLYDFRKDLIYALQKQGEIVAVVPKNDKWQELCSIVDKAIELPLDRRGMNPIHDFSLFCKYRQILREIKPKLVITYTIKPNVYGGIACRMAHIPYAVNITGLGSAIENGGLLRKFILMLYKVSLKGARVVFFENAANRDALVNAGVVPQGRNVVLNGAGVNLNDYPYQEYPNDGTVRFLFVGRIMKEKGVDEFFVAAERMKKKYGKRVEFRMAGMFEEAYKQKIDELVNDGIIEYLGYQADMKSLYGAASCVVLPSYHEGMSNVLLEAAATGRPLITSDIPGCREAVEDGVSGYICPAKDADALYDAMQRFVELPESWRAEMGRRGRERMEKRYHSRMKNSLH
jgi:glycosyltransferase involved in cell wall biosynthesis